MALVTNLFKKAASFEKGYEIITPEKQGFYNDIQEMKEKVNQIYNLKVIKNSQKMKSLQGKNKKIVAWLLNRSIDSLKNEREEFFK